MRIPTAASIIPEGAERQINPEDVMWEMTWEPREKYPEKPATEMMFEPDKALALLILNNQVMLNRFLRREDGGSPIEEISVSVNCNDVFAWGCADCETLPFNEIENLYRMWAKDRMWGTAIWCMIQRMEMPQGPVEKRIRESRIWDLDDLKSEHNLRVNYADGVSKVFSAQPPIDWNSSEGKAESERRVKEFRKANGYEED